ncbi:MAG TPA: glycosyltransferase, partial [Patescibacteria group bacterium]|nr:glycosyltransferase [Patescibacteria group bacterium]
MKILMISSYLPYPLHSGGQVRLYNLIKELSDKHEITLICEKRPHQTEDDVVALEKICTKVITVPRRKQWSLSNIAKSATSSSSFLVTGHTSRQMQEKIETLLRSEKFDLIHVETFYVLQNLVASATYQSSPLPTVLVEHNIEYQVYKRFMNRAPRPMRPLLAIDIAKIQKEEEAAWQQVTKVVAVSTRDKEVIEQTGLKPALVANGVNLDQFSFQDSTSSSTSTVRNTKKVLFIGDFAWLQNRDSVEFIIQEIWPLIRSKFKVTLWIVARRIPDSIRNFTDDKDVIFDEESSAKK